MKKWLKIVLVSLLLLLLVAIRYFENELFYDPFIRFFRSEHNTEPIPAFDVAKMFLNIAFRYILNMLVSLAILWVVFRNGGILKVSAVLYSVLFFVLFAVYIFLIYTSNGGTDHLILFYIRRFLIQPLFLFILLPAFYFQRKKMVGKT